MSRGLKTAVALTTRLFLFAAFGPLAAQTQPPVAAVRPVTDDYFGTEVVDPYRWMESGGPELTDYMTEEDKVTRATLAPYAAQDEAFLARLTALSKGVARVRSVHRVRDRFFYLELSPDRDTPILATRNRGESEKRTLLDPAEFAKSDSHAAIDFFEPSPDGKYVVVGVSPGGSENSTLYVIETASGKRLSESISRTQSADPSWDEKGEGFYYSRLQVLPEGAPASAKYENMRVYFHRLGTDPEKDVALFGPDVVSDPLLPKLGHVNAVHLRGTQLVLAGQKTGVVETTALWRRNAKDGRWEPVVGHEDGMLKADSRGTTLYLISKTGAPNGKLVSFDAHKDSFAQAREILPESDLVLSSRTSSGVVAARDALYVYGERKGLAVVERLPYGSKKPVELTLPVTGSLHDISADLLRDGIVIGMDGWTAAPRYYFYDPASNAFRDTGLQTQDPADFSGITASEVEVPSADGTHVPVSIIYRRDLKHDGSNPTLVEAYGAYGYSLSPFYSTARLPWLERGGIYAVAHVRGGGENGEAWHLAGQKLQKQHTIDDFVAATQYLVKEGFTSREHLAIEGTSAGGIAVGGFLTQHPEMVSAVLYRVGITDLLRSEQRATGTANAAEYGSVKIQPEFRAMYAISPYARVAAGTAYPAVLLETGANDPRVTSWMLTKMTARLQAANASDNPILLRVDFDAGHGLGSDRSQALRLKADEYTFLGWRLGMDGF
ncbi:MAG: prolyl oligopeptidase family serine peptidase [Burkholderiaceae bacterium]|jgi:prolyl oligopeptidase